MNKAKIQKMINTAPKQWVDMFQHHGLGKKPTVDKLIDVVLDYTPTMRSSGAEGKAKYVPTKKVRQEAWKGLVLAHKHNWSSKSGIGLVRAMQLVVEPKIWERSVLRMKAYFARHTVDKKGKNFGNDAKPSRGYIAWLAWGGDSGKAWANKIVKKDNLSKSKLKNPRRRRNRSGIGEYQYHATSWDRLPSIMKKGLQLPRSSDDVSTFMHDKPSISTANSPDGLLSGYAPQGALLKLRVKRGAKYWKRSLVRHSKKSDKNLLDTVNRLSNEARIKGYDGIHFEEWQSTVGNQTFNPNVLEVVEVLNNRPTKNPRRRRNRRDVAISKWDHPMREGSEVQTVMFSRKHFDGNTARAWLRKHDFKAPKMDKTINYLRYRQQEPETFHQKSFRTITFSEDKGIKAVVGIPKRIPKRRNGSKNIVLVNGRNMGSLDEYLSKYADDFTPKELAKIRQGWSSFDKDKSSSKSYDFRGHKFNYESMNFSGREYAQVFQEVLYIDPKRIRLEQNEYGDENWRWFASATDKQKVAWAKKQWKQKGKNPIAVSVDQGNFGVYMTDGHHRLRAATLLGLKVPIVIERTSLPYEEAKRIIVENIPTLYNPRRRNGSTISSQIGKIIVTKDIPNRGSLSASYNPNEYNVIGVKLIPVKKFGSFDKRNAKSGYSYGSHEWFANRSSDMSKAKDLKKAIANNKWIDPLIVGEDEQGLFVFEGQHRYVALRELGVSHIPALLFQEINSNPRRRNGSTRLVPKEQVRMVGFCPKKTKVVQPEIKHALALIEKIEQRKILFPTPIRPMTKDEFMDGRSVVDNGHPRGAGHGQYDPNKQEVAVNGNMQPFDLIANIFHENLHHARPDWSEEQVRDLTGEAMLYLYGEYNLGKPYAEGRLEAKNFRRNRSTMAKKETRDSKGRLIPQKYLVSYKGKQLQARIKELEQRRDEYAAALKKYGDEDKFTKSVIKKLYRPFKTDKGKKGKRSKYTIEAEKRGFVGSIPEKAKAATRYYGGKVDASILKEVNKRGMAAWASGGHRAGQTSHSWGIARVNSFLTGGKTFFTADKKLAEKLPSKVRKAIEKERTYIA